MKRTQSTDQDRAIAAQAARESHPYTAREANYDIARIARQARAEGAQRRAA